MNRGYIFIFLATVFFSSMEVALKTVAHDFNPMQLNCTRFLVGGLLLIPFALRGLRQHGAKITAAAWKGFAWLGFVGLVVSMMFYQMSILYAPASVVSVLFSCNPVLVLPFAFLILHADDLGYNAQQNAAIAELWEKGLLTSTSLLPVAPRANRSTQERHGRPIPH